MHQPQSSSALVSSHVNPRFLECDRHAAFFRLHMPEGLLNIGRPIGGNLVECCGRWYHISVDMLLVATLHTVRRFTAEFQ
jgi:hypothetical protein